MKEEVNEIVSNNLKDILNIVITGFITLDFFSPITFKFIASFFEEETDMMWIFATFRVFYLSFPLIFLFGFLIYKVNIKDLFNSNDVADFKRQFIVLSIVFLLFLVFVFFGIGRFPHKINEGIEVIKTQFLLTLIIFLFIAIYLFLSVRRYGKFKFFIHSIYIFLFSITVVGVIFVLVLRTGKLSGEQFTTTLETLYCNPFAKQKILNDPLRFVDSLDSEKKSINIATYEIAIKASLFDFKEKSQEYLIKINSPWINNLENISFPNETISETNPISILIKNDLEKLSSDSIKKSDLQEIKARADLIDRIMTLTLFHAENSLAQEARQAKNAAISLLRFVQVVELFFLISIIAILWLTIRFFKSFKSLAGKTMYLQTTLIIYFLMAVQMVKPIDPSHIEINDPGWAFTQPSWYLPGYIQSIGTISNNIAPLGINSEKSTVTIQERILDEEISRIRYEIETLRPLVEGKLDKIDSIINVVNKEFE